MYYLEQQEGDWVNLWFITFKEEFSQLEASYWRSCMLAPVTSRYALRCLIEVLLKSIRRKAKPFSAVSVYSFNRKLNQFQVKKKNKV